MFVKNRGHFVIAIKASCVDSTAAPEVVYANGGSPEDFATLDRMGIDVRGRIVLMRPRTLPTNVASRPLKTRA